MNNKRCAYGAAAVLTVCTVAFWCGTRTTDEAAETVSAAASTSVAQAVNPAVPAFASAQSQLTTNQTATVRGTKPYVLTSERNIGKPLRLAAEALGARTVGVLSKKSLLVEADEATVMRLSADSRFTVKNEFLPSDKIAPALAKLIAGGAKDVEVTFVTLAPEDRMIVQQRLASRGGEILQGCFNEGDSFSARIPAALVAEFAAFGDVRWMERFVRPHLTNARAVEPAAMNVQAAWDELGLSGAGQAVSTSDSGIDTGDLATMHEDLRDRILDMKAAPCCDMHDLNGHGTHTAGSIVGNGKMSDGKIRGTAWGAKLCAWFCGRDGTRSVYTPETVAELFRGNTEGTAWDAYIHSASWGSDTAGEYTADCERFDTYLWSHPDFLPVVSAGNAGAQPTTIGSPAAAKNVLAVGATLNQPKGSPATMAKFSSRGPCADGRIKPDIAAPGDSVTSTRSSLTEGEGPYTAMSGTSMACPLTAGSVALVREWLMRDKGFTDAEPPTAALLKAIVTGGAKDAAKPNYEQGWGRVDLKETLAPSAGRAVKLIDRIPFENRTELAWIVETTNAAPLDVQLAWVDYPGVSSGSQTESRLVNDLDLTVCPLDGDGLYYGNGRINSPDFLNNLESVRLESAPARRYLVSVSCKDLPYDYTDGGAAALYIRGAFDPDGIEAHSAVRIVTSPETTNTYARLDTALLAAKTIYEDDPSRGAVQVEVVGNTELRQSVSVDFPCEIRSVERPFSVSRGQGVKLSVASNGVVGVSGLVFTGATSTFLEVEKHGRVRVGGGVDFGVPRTVAAIETADANGFTVTAAPTVRYSVRCAAATKLDSVFGFADCDFETARTLAAQFVSVDDPNGEIAGVPVEGESAPYALKWSVLPVPFEDAGAYYVVDDEPDVTNCFRRIDRLFEKFAAVSAPATVTILEGGTLSRLVRPQGNLTVVSPNEAVVLDLDPLAGFTVTNGTLTVSNLVFRNHTGANSLFAVNGAAAHPARLVLRDSVVANCERSNGTSGYGGAVYLAGAGCSLLLDGATITNCFASYYGGGVYAGSGAAVELAGTTTVQDNWKKSTNGGKEAQNIYMKGTDPLLKVVGDLSGEKSVGVFYYGSVAAGKVDGAFATVGDGIVDGTACADAFFNDKDGTLEAVYDDSGKTLKWREIPAEQRGKEADFDGARVKVTYADDGKVLYYERLKYAIPELTGDAVIELRSNDTSSASLVITNAVTLCTDLAVAKTRTFRRSGQMSIVVKPGASLVVSNLNVFGYSGSEPTTYTVPLINAESAELVLQDGATIAHVRGTDNRDANAVTVWNGSTFRMESGAVIFDSANDYYQAPDRYSVGAGLLFDNSTAYLTGGMVSNCAAWRAGGVYVGNRSTAYVSGDFTVVGNVTIEPSGLESDPLVVLQSDLSVSDNSTFVLADVLTGSIGYVEGVNCDTNVFGIVGDTFPADQDAAESAKRFTNNRTFSSGTVDSEKKLLVWANDGPVVVALPKLVEGLVYTGNEQTGVVERTDFTLTGHVATDAGIYTATASLSGGSVWPDGSSDSLTFDWEIAQAIYDMSGVSFTNATFLVDGKSKSIYVSGELPDGVIVAYEGNEQTTAGVYTVVAHFSGDAINYEPIPDMTATMTLVKDPENPDPPPTPPEWTVVTNWPDPIAFMSIDRLDETTWALVITNRKPFCRYRLLYTDDLTQGFVHTGKWEKAASDVDPVWTTNVVCDGNAWFWRAEGTYGTNMVPPQASTDL